MKEEMKFRYLSGLNEDEMEDLLKIYEEYMKSSSAIRIPGTLILAVVGASRIFLKSISRDQMVVFTVTIMAVLLIWTFRISYRILRQKKEIKSLLNNMAALQEYPFNEVKKEFNSLTKAVYKGPKI